METNTLPQFPRFSSLPTELKHMIYRFMIPPPRLIRLYTSRGELIFTNTSNTITRRRQPFRHAYCSKLPVPIILRICQESRFIGLEHYSLVFDTNPRPSIEDMESFARRGDPMPILPFKTPALAYVDLDSDIIYLTNDTDPACTTYVEVERRGHSRVQYSVQPPPQSPLHKYINIPSYSFGRFEHSAFMAAIPPFTLQKIKYLAMSVVLFGASTRFAGMNRHLKDENGVKGVIVIRNGLGNGDVAGDREHRPLARILRMFGDVIRERVVVVSSEASLLKEIESDGGKSIWSLATSRAANEER